MSNKLEYQRKYRKNNRDYVNWLAAKQRYKDRDKINLRQKIRRALEKEKRLAKAKKCKTCNKPLAVQNKYGYCYPHGKQVRWQKFYKKNKKLLSKKSIERNKIRKQIDPAFRACCNARNRVLLIMRNKTKFSKTLGCSFTTFKQHIESQFQTGMTWKNYGQWHVDHIYPLSVAYAKGPEVFKKACSYKNLQPLWAKDNIKKRNTITSFSI